jgi:hypothetical protein
MVQTCADCGSRDFKSCFNETFPARGRDGTPQAVTLRLCLACGARFPDRAQLRGHLHAKLPAFTREGARI